MPVKRSVDTINQQSLALLDTPEIKFKYITEYKEETDTSGNTVQEPKTAFDLIMTTKQTKPKKQKKISAEALEKEENFIINNSLFEKDLTLKAGAQVMCIYNLDMENGICNGSTGIITHFTFNGTHHIPVVKFNNGIVKTINHHTWESENIQGFCIKQIPLILAWAVTIHKSQGATLDCAEIDIGSNVFASGQTYVALSRVKSLDGLYLKSFNPNKIKTDKKVIEFYNQFYEEVSDDEET